MTAQELKNSILQLAIQGKLVKQDPNDEPASVLLEKIKEEREKLIKEKKIKREKYSEIYKDPSDNHYYEKFEDGTINDITEEIPFDIPDSWRWERFNNIFNIINGFTPLKGNKDFWNSNDINWFTVDDFNEQGYEINYTNQFISNKALGKNTNRILPKDTVIICCTASIGTVAIANIPLTTNQQFNGLVKKLYFSNFFVSKFIYYYCLTLKKAMLDKAGKTTFPFLSVKKLGKFIIPFPPINEQYRIIKKLEAFNHYIKRYDSIYNNLERLNHNYKEELKKSILQYAIQGKLVKQDPNDESAEVLINEILDEKRKLIKAKQIKAENLSVIYKDSTDNQFYEKFDDGTINNITDEIPFEIPNNWCWTRLRNIGIYKKGPFGSALTKNIFVTKSKNTIKVYEQKNAIQKNATLGEYYITKEYFEKNMTSFEVLPNDIIVSCAGTIGETYVMPKTMEKGIINQALMRMRISELFSQKYFLLYFDYVLKKSSAKKSNGSAIKNIPPFDIFKEFLVAVPPILEQNRIGEKLDIMFNIIETAE